MSEFRAKVSKEFLSSEEVNYLISFAESLDNWETGGGPFWENRVLNASNVYKNHDKNIGELLYDIRLRTSKAISSLYNVNSVYPDITQIVRWFPGQEQPPHADDMTNTEDNDWFHHREFGTIIYLNDDYSGGHTYYPQHQKEIKPERGMLAIHPGDTDHMHGVTKIEDKVRYTIAAFWSQDKEYFDGWSIP